MFYFCGLLRSEKFGIAGEGPPILDLNALLEMGDNCQFQFLKVERDVANRSHCAVQITANILCF